MGHHKHDPDHIHHHRDDLDKRERKERERLQHRIEAERRAAWSPFNLGGKGGGTPDIRTSPREKAVTLSVAMLVAAGVGFFAGGIYGALAGLSFVVLVVGLYWGMRRTDEADDAAETAEHDGPGPREP